VLPDGEFSELTIMPLAEIYRSTRLADCEQRAFVLRAVGIEHVVQASGELFGLLVPEELASSALHHLRSYDEESRVLTPAPAPIVLHPHAAVGSVFYTAIVISVAYCAGRAMLGVDWNAAGGLTAAAFDGAQWWRAITALTLHADLGHLLGNLAFGVPFGFFAAQLLGTGRAWLSILVAATAGNLLDSALMSQQQTTIGASTAVFAMLGLVAAYAWRHGSAHPQRWAQRWSLRWAPLIAGVALLGITGAAGEHTDVIAHLAGFASGAILGVVHGHWPHLLAGRRSQRLAGTGALAAVVIAWTLALRSL
jgi:rhomboid protease GluP